MASATVSPCLSTLNDHKSQTNRIALYARVSTANTHQDPEVQLRELREYAARRDWQVVQEYVDRGVSGAKSSRPALNELMHDAQRRRFDGVLVWKLDRFGRSLRHLINSLADFESWGVSFVSLHDALDLGSASGRLLFQIIGAMGEFERSLIQERVRAGIRHARSKGKVLGRPRVFVSETRVEGLRASGASWREIAVQLGVGLGTVYRTAQKCSKIECGGIAETTSTSAASA